MNMLHEEYEEFKTLLKVIETTGEALLAAKTPRERRELKDDFEVALEEVKQFMCEILYRKDVEEIYAAYNESDPDNDAGCLSEVEECRRYYFGDDEEE